MAPLGADNASSSTANTGGLLKRQGGIADNANKKGADVAPSSTKKGEKTAQEDVKESKLSGAELKKRAKEEKKARRAKEKQDKQAGVPSQIPQVSVLAPGTGVKQLVSGPPNAKEQKRRGSATGNAKQQLPIRTSELPMASVAAAPKKDSKNVALFSHLYGQPRRTTMTGAGKDIHPAVVTLGLKMSHYMICGSNARCVAMLLAFKRVRLQ